MSIEDLIEVKSSLQNTVKRVFLSWSQSMTCQCYANNFAIKAHFISRLIWTCVFLSFSCLTSYILLGLGPTVFPAVTICGANPFTTEHADNLILFVF